MYSRLYVYAYTYKRQHEYKKGKSGKFVSCNWRISSSAFNSAVPPAELVGISSVRPDDSVLISVNSSVPPAEL